MVAPSPSAVAEVRRIVGWYLRQEYGRSEGPGRAPYFSDRARVGPFAVDLDALRARDNEALFRLLVVMGLYQSRRDVDIMALQRTMPVRAWYPAVRCWAIASTWWACTRLTVQPPKPAPVMRAP